MTTKTMRCLRGKNRPIRGFTGRKVDPTSDAETVNSKEDDVSGFPPLRRENRHNYTAEDIRRLHANLDAKSPLRMRTVALKNSLSGLDDVDRRSFLASLHAVKAIDDEQLELFWPGDEG